MQQAHICSFPASLKSLGDRAFALCGSLTSIWCKATVPPEYIQASGYESDGTPFTRVNPLTPVYIPVGTKQQYMAAPGWDYMTNFIETDNFPIGRYGYLYWKSTQKDMTTILTIYSGRKVETPVPGNIYIRTAKVRPS